MTSRNPKIVVIGGGTGAFTLLSSIKEISNNITAIVNMSDDGGSTGVLRDELGVLPPGDIRQCLVALSNNPEVRDLFNYRFENGRLRGQSLGNIIISGLELKHGSFDKAIKVVGNILNISGKVVPATLDNHKLIAIDGSKLIEGESRIGSYCFQSSDIKLQLVPRALINPDAKQAIAEADLIVIAPGNLYGTLLPILAISGMKQAISKSKALVVSVVNLVTKPGQTDGWHVVDYVKKFEQYLGKNQIDVVLFNNKVPSKYLLWKYATDGEFPVSHSKLRFNEINSKTIGASLVAKKIATQDPSDHIIKRTLIRHDAKIVARKLQEILDK